jgi:uncharacterized protein (UPF0333 family)
MKLVSSKKGQVLVEYLLLMVITIGIATILTKQLVYRGEKPGLIIKAWDSILKNISNDLPDCDKQTNFSQPNCG